MLLRQRVGGCCWHWVGRWSFATGIWHGVRVRPLPDRPQQEINLGRCRHSGQTERAVAPVAATVRGGIYPPRTHKLRRCSGMIHAADAAEDTTQLTELEARRPCSRRAGAHRARSPMPAHMGSAAQLPAACRSHHVCGLEGRRHTSSTGPGFRLRSRTTRSDSRD